MQIMKKHLILIISAVFLSSCAGTGVLNTSQSVKSSSPQSQETVIDSEKGELSATESRAESENVATEMTPYDESVFSQKGKGLSAEVFHYLMVAEIAGQRGKIDIAVANYVQAAKISQDPNVAERASRIAVFGRKDKAALEAANIWVKLVPKSAEAHQIVAAMLVRTGNLNGALKHFERVLSLSDKGEQQTFMLITSLLGKERDKHIALDIMKRLLDKHQNSSSAYYSYANLALLTKEYEIANKAVDKALSLKKNWNEASILKATILSRLDRDEEAIAWLEQTLKQYSDNHKLRMYFARKLVDSKKYDIAYKEFKKVYSVTKNDDALYAMGLLANRMDKIDVAKKHFKRLSKIDGRESAASYYLGQIEEKQKDFSNAISWYSKVRGGVYAFDSKLRIIILLGKQGKVAQARAQAKTINVTKPAQQVRLYVAEGEVLRVNKMYPEALELYTESLSAIPDNLDLIYARALIYEKLNNVVDAIIDLRTIVKLDSQNVQALNALGYTLVDKTEQIHEGMEYIKQAYQLRPADPAIIDSMGWAYYRLGKLDKAVTFLKRAFTSFNDAEVAAHLGEVLWVRGDKDEARKIWKNSLRDTPKHDTLLNVMKRFMP